jgi:hypothetical protein
MLNHTISAKQIENIKLLEVSLGRCPGHLIHNTPTLKAPDFPGPVSLLLSLKLKPCIPILFLGDLVTYFFFILGCSALLFLVANLRFNKDFTRSLTPGIWNKDS